jgi:hypothetical protein
MLISPEYRDLNKHLHATRSDYGVGGYKWAPQVEQLANAVQARTILDYGCGRATLSRAIKSRTVINYDPAIDEYSSPPEPADLVVSTDCLEHVEPECLDDVLDTLSVLGLKAVFLVVATRPAKKVLADGRNAHLIVEPAKWWLARICHRWDLRTFVDNGGEFMAVGTHG